mgnify:CR=1 FL=1
MEQNEDKAKVSVFNIIPNKDAVNILFGACRTCYSKCNNPEELWDIVNNATEEKKIELITKVMKSGHLSVLEHVQVSFIINNISRACSHQLVRHRHASFSQQGQRYVKEKNFKYIIPDSIKQNEEALSKYIKIMEDINGCYQDLLNMKIKAEDARFVLPQATTTSIFFSTNLSEMIWIANVRLCNRAQKEIRDVTRKICDLTIQEYPWMRCFLVPKCIKNGYCPEEKSCGYYTQSQKKE